MGSAETQSRGGTVSAARGSEPGPDGSGEDAAPSPGSRVPAVLRRLAGAAVLEDWSGETRLKIRGYDGLGALD